MLGWLWMASCPCPCIPVSDSNRAGTLHGRQAQNTSSRRVEVVASTDRADLEHLAVVAGLERNAELAAAVVPGHDRHHGDDGLAPGCRRAPPSRFACLPSLIRLRVVGNGSLKRPLSPPSSASRGDTQIEVGGFLAVMGADLFRRRGGEEEPGVEPLRHALRRDPVRIGHEFVERQHHAVVGQHLEEASILPSHSAARCAASISLARLASTSAFDPFGRASRMPLSSKVSRIAAMRKLSVGLVEPLAAGIQLGRRR